MGKLILEDKVKKAFLSTFILFVVIVTASAAKPKATKAAPVQLDWQGRDAGIQIPDWTKAVAENNKRKIVKEFDLDDYMVWVFNARGTNLDFLETWTDKVELQSNVAQSISAEIGRATQATMQAEQNLNETKINQAITDVTTVLSNVRVNGLERFGSYWIKSGIAKSGVKKIKTEDDCDITYAYYTVWGIPKKAFKSQLDAAMQNLPENTAQDPLLMKMIVASIEKTILGDADASLEETTYDDVK